MSDNKKDPRKSTTTTTETTGRSTDDSSVLTPEEEKAVRMRHGLTEDGDRKLEFAPGASAETMAKLANLEKFLVEKFGETRKVEGVFDSEPDDASAKQMIIDRLKDAQDES